MTNEVVENSNENEIVETQTIVYATSVMRLVANIIDFIILTIPYTVINKFMGGGFFQEILVSILILCFYLLFWNKKQATPGKMIFSMKIVDEITLLRARKEKYFLRAVLLFSPIMITSILDNLINSIFNNWKIFNILFSTVYVILTAILILCLVSVFLSRKNQGIHDNLLGLAVIYD